MNRFLLLQNAPILPIVRVHVSYFKHTLTTCLTSRVSVSNKQGGRKAASVASTLDFLAMPIKVVFNLKRPAFLSSAPPPRLGATGEEPQMPARLCLFN